MGHTAFDEGQMLSSEMHKEISSFSKHVQQVVQKLVSSNLSVLHLHCKLRHLSIAGSRWQLVLAIARDMQLSIDTIKGGGVGGVSHSSSSSSHQQAHQPASQPARYIYIYIPCCIFDQGAHVQPKAI